MSWSIDAVIIAPSEYLTEGRFASYIAGLGRRPDSWVPDWTPSHSDAPLFSTVIYPTVQIAGIEMYFDSSFSDDGFIRTDLPDGLACLRIFADHGFLKDDLENQDLFFKIVKEFFLEFNGIYGVIDHEFLMENTMSFREFLKVLCSIHMFSQDVIDSIGRDEFDAIKKYGDEDDARWLRFDRDYYNGLPTAMVGRMQLILDLMWDRYDFSLSSGDPTRAEEALKDLPPVKVVIPDRQAPNTLPISDYWQLFFIFYYPEENHTESNCQRLFMELLDIDEYRTEFKGKERFQKKIKQLLLGYFSINHHFYSGSKSDPPLKAKCFEGRCITLSGTELFNDFGPLFQWPGHRCMMIISWKPKNVEIEEYGRSFLDVVRAFSSNFSASFGFGDSHYSSFARQYQNYRSFIDHLWAINVLNAERHEGGFIERLRRFSDEHNDKWEFTPINDSISLLSIKPIDTATDDISTEGFSY